MAFHKAAMYFGGRVVTSSDRVMLLVAGHGRMELTGVDLTRADIHQFDLATRVWSEIKPDNVELPMPGARLTFAGGLLDGADVIELFGSTCVDTYGGLVCQPVYSDMWAFDLSGSAASRFVVLSSPLPVHVAPTWTSTAG
jgi:hypothetical protein